MNSEKARPPIDDLKNVFTMNEYWLWLAVKCPNLTCWTKKHLKVMLSVPNTPTPCVGPRMGPDFLHRIICTKCKRMSEPRHNEEGATSSWNQMVIPEVKVNKTVIQERKGKVE